MRGPERLEKEVRNFKLTISGLQRSIDLHYEDLVFEPPLEEIFQRSEGIANLEVSLSLMKENQVVPNGSWEGRVLFAEIEPHRPLFQLQKLIAALSSLDSDYLYSLHCGLTKPPNLEEKTVAIIGASKTGKGTILSRLCQLSDPISGYRPEVFCSDRWEYLTDDVLLFNSGKERTYLIGKARTRCINFPQKRIVIEPGSVNIQGYSVGIFMLLDKNIPGGGFERLELPLEIPKEVISHPDVASPIYQAVIDRPSLTITNIPVYKLGTDGNIPGTLKAINDIINQFKN